MSHDDIAPRVLRSVGAASMSHAWRIGVTLGAQLFLRRYVPEADWGLFNWALVVFLVIGAVRDLGLNAHVLRIHPRPFGNLLLVETLWNGCLVLLTLVGAPLLAAAFPAVADHPETIPVLRALTLFLFFEGLAMVPLSYLHGELLVGRAVVPELARNLGFALVAVGLALAGMGVWSMVFAQVAGAAVYAAMLWWRVRGLIPLQFQRGGTLRLLASSYRLAVIWLLALTVQHVDLLVLGALTDARTLGTYAFAYFVAFLVPTTFLTPVGRVAFPALIAYRSQRRRQFDTYRLATLVLLCLEVPAALFLFTNAPLVLDIFGGRAQWEGAAGILIVLCFAPLIDPLSRLGGEVLASRHRDGWWIAASTTTLLSFVVFGVLLTMRYGAIGMAWANFLPLGGGIMCVALLRVSPKGLRRLFRELAWVYLIPLPFFAAVWMVSGGVWPTGSPWRMALSFAALLGVAGVYLWRFGSDFRAYFAVRTASPDAAVTPLP